MPETDFRLKSLVGKVEKGIIRALIVLMSLLLILATLELAYQVVTSVLGESAFIIELDALMDLFGVFMLVLIGIELLDTIKVYFKEHVIHVEVVMLVAIIAIARKIILVDFNKFTAFEVLSVAALVLALAAGYYLIKLAGGCGFWPEEPLSRQASPRSECGSQPVGHSPDAPAPSTRQTNRGTERA